METMGNLWNLITGEIKSQVNEQSLKMFLSMVNPVKIDQGTLFVEAENEFSRDWLERKYRSIIQKILQEANPPLVCSFLIRKQEKKTGKPVQLGFPLMTGETTEATEKNSETPSSAFEKPILTKMDPSFNTRYTFDSFVVGKSNQFAHAVCQAVAKSPGTVYNPVFIYGGVGLGKTHLMQAIGQEVFKNHPKSKVVYLSSETFTNEFIDALRDKKTNEFRAKYRKKDLLLIDDVQFFVGKEAVIEEFFHTFNELFQNKKQIVLTSDSPPKKMNKLEARLVSRFEMGVVADIQPPDVEMRVAILKKAATRVVAKIPEEVLMYIAQNVTTNIRELEGAFNKIVAYGGILQKKIDCDLVDQVLKDYFRENSPGQITIPWIQKRIAQYYDIPEIEMISKRRSQNLVLPRQVAMRLAQILTDSSLSQIGSAFGGRDHTTVLHASDKIQKMIQNDQKFADEFERMKRYVTPQNS
jgi:chromosomal replication initiator protein